MAYKEMNLVGLGQKDMDAFFSIADNRRAKIAAASAETPKYPFNANIMAEALHPAEQQLQVKEIIKHNVDVITYVLERTDGVPAWFRAGQYLSIKLPIGGTIVSRPYSISSTPFDTKKGFYTITVKRVDEGFGSPYILDNWKIGTQVVSSGPLGTFYYEPLRDAKKVIGTAGGSGITPFLSLAGAIRDGVEDCNLTILYGSRSKEDILFYDEFEKITSACSKVKVVHVLSGRPAEGCESGFITAELIKKYAPKDEAYSMFMCGPQQMYLFVDKEIEKLGLEKKFVRHELFGERKNPEKLANYPGEDVNKTYRLTVTSCGDSQVIDCKANESILVALERAGIACPAHCRSGECGFCRSRLISGNVFVPSEYDGRRQADLKFNYIHPCCSYALSDLAIDVPAV